MPVRVSPPPYVSYHYKRTALAKSGADGKNFTYVSVPWYGVKHN